MYGGFNAAVGYVKTVAHVHADNDLALAYECS